MSKWNSARDEVLVSVHGELCKTVCDCIYDHVWENIVHNVNSDAWCSIQEELFDGCF